MIVRKTLSLLGVFVLLLVSACSAPKKTAYGHTKGVLAKHGMVVSAKEEASKIGLSILKKGGNAFDAMVATELALAVAYPNAGNIGGGGFMVYRLAKKVPWTTAKKPPARRTAICTWTPTAK